MLTSTPIRQWCVRDDSNIRTTRGLIYSQLGLTASLRTHFIISMTQVGPAGTAEVESAACSLGDCCSVQLSYVPANPTHAHLLSATESFDIGSETAAGFEPARGLSTIRVCSPPHSSALPYRLATGTPTLQYIVSYRSLDICFAIAACWRRQNFSSSDTLVRVCCSSRYATRVSVDIEEDRRPSFSVSRRSFSGSLSSITSPYRLRRYVSQ